MNPSLYQGPTTRTTRVWKPPLRRQTPSPPLEPGLRPPRANRRGLEDYFLTHASPPRDLPASLRPYRRGQFLRYRFGEWHTLSLRD